MNNKIVLLLILVFALFTVACSQEPSNSGKQETQQTQNKANENEVPSESTGFVKNEVFKGGSESKNYTLNGLRKRPNSEATRIHMNFGLASDNTKTGEPPVLADNLPLFEISYLDSEKKITAIFKNVKWDVSKDKIQALKEQAPIIKSIDFETKDGNLYLNFSLKEQVYYQVLHSEQPAGISILIKPDTEN